LTTGAVIEFHRGRPQHRDGFDIVRFREIEARRHPGIAWRPPIGFPARLELKRDAAEQHRAAARARQQPDRGIAVPLPWRRIPGVDLVRQGRHKYGSGQAERGPQGNYDGHETSLQAGKVANH
jgi:hypothetical protein